MADEPIEFRSDYTPSNKTARELERELNEANAQAAALNDDVRKARIAGRKARIAHPEVAREAPTIDEATAALAKENAAKQRGKALTQENVQLELKYLDVIKAENAAMAERRALSAGTYGPARGPIGIPAGQMSFADIGQAERLANQQRYAAGLVGAQAQLTQLQTARTERLTAAVAAEADARARTLAIEEAQIRADRLRAEMAQRQAILQEHMATSYAGGRRAAQGSFGLGPGLGKTQRAELIAAPAGVEWSKAEQGALRLQTRLGEYASFGERADLATSSLSANLTRLGMVEAETSNNLRRHGALTTEYLSALARGETTVSELGYQLGATIGKFAGWATAAAATYGALGAVVEFGKGAIDTSNAVGRLSRTIQDINPDQAAEKLRTLSRETNVSMSEAGDATFQFSRTFHNVADAAEAAHLGLAAFKLDNVDLATSVRMQTSIHQQYGYNLQQLGSVYDMLAAGQREYNARITDVTAALQKSTGSVRNARGDLTELVQIAEYATRVTQIGGAQVGTAIYRSAATQAYTPAHQQTLRGFGLNTDQSWTQLFDDALRRAVTMTGDERRQLANALFGNQFGGRMAAVFNPQNLPTYEQMRQRITPEATRGSMEEEMGRQLATTREQLSAFVNELQRLGGALAETGAFAGLGVVLHSATGFLSVIESITNAFDQLNPNIRHFATWLIEARAASLFFSRTRFGSTIPGLRNLRIPGIDPPLRDVQMRREMSVGTTAGLASLDRRRGELSAEFTVAGRRALTLAQQEREIRSEITAAGVGTEEQYAEANAKSSQIVGLQRKQMALELEFNAVLAARGDLQKQSVALTAMSRNKRIEGEELRALNTRIGRGPLGGEDSLAPGLGTAAAARTDRALATAARQKTTEMETARLATRDVSMSARATGVVSSRMLQATVAGTAMWQRAGGALAGLGKGLMGMARAMDPVMIGLLMLPEMIALVQHQWETVDKNTQGLIDTDATMPPRPRGLTGSALPRGGVFGGVARGASLSAVPGLWGATGTRAPRIPIPRELEEALDPKFEATHVWDFRGIFAEAFGYGQSRTNVIDEANLGRRTTRALAKSLVADRARTYASPVQQVGYTLGELGEEARADSKLFREQEITKQEYGRRMQELQRSASSSLEMLIGPNTAKASAAVKQFGQAVKDELASNMAAVARTAHDLVSNLDRMDTKTLLARGKTASARQQTFGLSPADTDRAVTTALYMAVRFRNATDPDQLSAVQAAGTTATSAMSTYVQGLLSAANTARTPAGEVRGAGDAVAAVRAARALVHDRVEALRKRWKGNASMIRAVNAEAARLDDELRANLPTAVEQLTQALTEQAQLRADQVQGSSPEAELKRARILAQGAAKALAAGKAAGLHGYALDQLGHANASAQQTASQSALQYADDVAQAREALAVSSITGTDPHADVLRARKVLENARADLARDNREHKGLPQILKDEAAINDAYRALLDTQAQGAQAIAGTAAAFIQSQADLAESRTTDPVKQARIQLAHDQQILGTIKRGDYKSEREFQTARNEQLAKIGKDRQTVNDQVVSTRMQTLQFELHTEQISNQQYISGLRRLLRLRHLSKQEIQTVRSAIFDAGQASSDLNVGSIRMPTGYEIRRALHDARQRGVHRSPMVQATVTHNNTFAITVARDGDIRKVTEAIGRALNTSVQVTAQAMGVV